MLVAQANLHQAITALKESGAWVIGLEGGGQAQSVDEVRLDGAIGLVVGSEGEGMRPLTARSCDIRLVEQLAAIGPLRWRSTWSTHMASVYSSPR